MNDRERSGGESGRRREAPEMWDLPLRGETPASLGPDSKGADRVGKPAPPARRYPVLRDRKAWRRKLWATMGVALALAAIAYLLFWPTPPKAVFHPDPMDLGQQRVGTPSEIQVLSVTNEGERPMPVSGLTLRGPAAEEFELVTEDCSARQLASFESCRVEVTLTPSSMGPREALVELQGDFRQAPVSLGLLGTGIAPRLQVSSEEVGFGSEEVGSSGAPATLTVSNGGTAALAIEAVDLRGASRADFRRQRDHCSSTRLEPGEECSIQWIFSPRAAGRRSAEVVFQSDTLGEAPGVRLEGRGEWTGPALSLSREALEFGDRLVGGEAASLSIDLTNRHDSAVSNLSVRLLEPSGPFVVTRQNCSDRSLAPGEACSIEVRFRAEKEGAAASTLAIDHEVGTLQVELTGRGVAPRLSLDAAELDFGELGVGAEAGRMRVILTNVGTAAANLRDVSIEGQDEAAFSKRGDGCSKKVLRPEDRCAVEIEFRPQREGGHEAAAVFGAAELKGVETVVLMGSGAAPRLTLNSEIVDFGEVRRTTVRDVYLTVSNPGTADLEIVGGRLATEVATDFELLGGSCLPRAKVPPGGTCTLGLRFSPGTEGRLSATLELDHNGITGPRRVPLGGVGLPPPTPLIRISPRRLDFGSQPVSERSSILTLTISNEGTGGLEFSSFDLIGQAATDFRIVPATCQAVAEIAAGSSCTLGVRFTPSAPGQRSASLVIGSNAFAGDSTVELVGSGLGVGGE